MTDKKNPPKTEAELKAERLAKALRDNLHRRKAQARSRDAAPTPAPKDEAE
ncbi:hypothetical protein [Zavarzinia aquatilis]|uniref:hypothetical protein n=1 Tax=Zavarzinia aquatilis TaxID=2211142 RepID=UPI001402643B|nr:hypothetical protein [Zavarzinia aquatilis]